LNDVTVWRLKENIKNANQMRDGLTAMCSDGEYLGSRTFWHGITPIASGFVYRFNDDSKADRFLLDAKSDELPPEPVVETNVETIVEDKIDPIIDKPKKKKKVKEKSPSRMDLVNPNGDTISVKKKDKDNLLSKGWSLPESDKKEDVIPAISTMVMWTGDGFVRVNRSRITHFESLGWKNAWDYYREKYHEHERIKREMAIELDIIRKDIENAKSEETA